jgi:alkanesulfonate monooxygenase SsuD/methylene tetrahydromethanopterin reductase-like flavin-dependent oxidoreductase (luciferase family)
VPELYAQVLAEAELAERLNYDAFFSAEHHFHHYGVVPNPPLLLATIAARTKRLRLGTAISILTFHNALTLAETYAMLDTLSNGRLLLGVGSGYLPHEFAGYNVNGAEKRERFDENLSLVRRLLSGERVTHEGKFATVRDVQLNVLPVQKQIPTFIAALRLEAAYHVGRQGLGLLGIPYASLDHFDDLPQFVDDYRRGRAEVGLPVESAEPNEIVCLHTHVAETDAEAERIARDPFDLYVATRLYARKCNYDDVIRTGLALFGSPETVANKMIALREMGIRHVMTMQNFGGMAAADVERSMRLMAQEVMPRVQRATEAVAA